MTDTNWNFEYGFLFCQSLTPKLEIVSNLAGFGNDGNFPDALEKDAVTAERDRFSEQLLLFTHHQNGERTRNHGAASHTPV